ncbi:MAG: rhamnulose-1-phosphate aldolase [Coriobacteriia bacterium]|nr:rhamnulose-1-phosphate aldolase [Coriobacteriia bacterium]
MEQLAVVRGFARVCQEGWGQGWHERNGGNLTCLLTDEQVGEARPFFREPGEWAPLTEAVPRLAGRVLLTTATGAHLRNVPGDVAGNAGMVEIAPDGAAWRMVWGFEGGGRPTSEISAHASCLAARRDAGFANASVVYHAHPSNLIAMTLLRSWDDVSLTRMLWRSMAECIIAAPYGVAVAGWITPGSAELAAACRDAMAVGNALVMAQHGVFCCGSDFDDAFSLLHTLDKAAGIYLSARAANGGSDEFANGISVSGLRDIAQRYDLPANPKYLEE